MKYQKRPKLFIPGNPLDYDRLKEHIKELNEYCDILEKTVKTGFRIAKKGNVTCLKNSDQ